MPAPASGAFRDLTQYDSIIASRFQIQIVPAFGGASPSNIPLQFPPRISSDGKNAEWTDSDQGAYEPIRTFNGSGARKLTLELTYIVTGEPWTADAIAEIGRNIRSYFYNIVAINFKGHPIVKIKAYDIVPAADGEILTCIMRNMSTRYDGAMIRTNDSIFPLKSVHTLELESATRIGPLAGGIVGAFGKPGEELVKLATRNLAFSQKPQWF
jgi:hypothetical protein